MAAEVVEANGMVMDKGLHSGLDSAVLFKTWCIQRSGMGYREHGSGVGDTECELSLTKQVVEMLSRQLEKKTLHSTPMFMPTMLYLRY